MLHKSVVLFLAGTSFAAVAAEARAAESAAPAPPVATQQASPVTTVGSQDIDLTAQ